MSDIQWNVPGQLAFLSTLQYEQEFVERLNRESPGFRFNNLSFGPGDAEYWYQIVRRLKPKLIIEIGSGQSTIIARPAIGKNRQESAGYECEHICIEPFEAPCDSSHIIRPQGDVLVEYLEILPQLLPGVTVHIHNIFCPRDYPRHWMLKKMVLWNEQYLLEGFLTGNRQSVVLAALNMLKHDHFDVLRRACPYLGADQEPGSMYIRKLADESTR